MNSRQTLQSILLFFALLISPAMAQFGKPRVQGEVISEFTQVQPGQEFRVAMKLKHDKGWHSYFVNDGIGNSIIPELSIEVPEGWKSGELQFPAPHEFDFAGAKVYGYEGEHYFIKTLTAPTELAAGSTVEIPVKASWQACDNTSCLPPNSSADTLILNVGAEPVANAAFSSFKEYAKKYFPNPVLPSDWEVSAAESADGGITLFIEGELPEGSHFYELDKQIDVQAARTHTAEGDVHRFAGKRNMGNALGGEAGPQLERLRGILHSPSSLGETGNQTFLIDVPFGGGGSSSSAVAAGDAEKPAVEADGLATPLVFASLLLGGLILNLMPCVFPVIGLKIMGFVQQAGEDTKKIKLHGLTFTVGVLLSFLVLAAVLFPLKATTTLGAQLQEPWVVFSVLIVMFMLALSMAGVFEIGATATSAGGSLTQKDGLAGSFFSGVLAVVIATPCSAPFLGPAIGAAWKFNGPLFFMALLTMGVGLALPYITLSFFPSLVNKLPRPGAWMESFKQGMSFLLFATAGYLLWIYNAQVGDVGQKGLAVMLGLTLFATAGWIYGRWNTLAKPAKTRAIAKLLTILFFAGGFVIAMPPKAQDPELAAAEAAVPEILWEKWTPERERELRDAGTPVFVDFTAKWCLTCQTNKATAYTAEVRQYIHDNGIVTLKADMTSSNAEATKAIHALDRSAIPVNVLYAPEDTKPHVTSEVLRPGYLLDFFQERIEK
ncbi:protein-disulfide reductase DsbD family protein [Rubritalea marina]|uniref:protein-disulfide reductase DsbD family protein n=1 Tax=Rubritalea marina TaxID=361055 RepID=UPI00037E571C|nr:thioredoxin family protein [Rubritalea marina]